MKTEAIDRSLGCVADVDGVRCTCRWDALQVFLDSKTRDICECCHLAGFIAALIRESHTPQSRKSNYQNTIARYAHANSNGDQ